MLPTAVTGHGNLRGHKGAAVPLLNTTEQAGAGPGCALLPLRLPPPPSLAGHLTPTCPQLEL